MKTLIIVESPTKAVKIQEYLGEDYIVLASKGHIADLAKGGKFGLGVDIKNNFKPHYILMNDKIDILNNLIAAAKQCDLILLTSDPDREGEAISWHLAQRLADVGKPIKRMIVNEIKKSKLQKAVKETRDIDMNLFHSQEARRILDRLVGFTASPFLMNFFGPKLSAGRVQSVVTKMIIDREREIENFKPETYFNIQVALNTDLKNKDNNIKFNTKYAEKITEKEKCEEIVKLLNNSEYIVTEVLSQEEKKNPFPPLITSTLQRIMSKNYGISADKTMKAAQSLYEFGYCTYIRTDSIRVGDEALAEARQWLTDNKYDIPKKANIFKNKDSVQDAHECIRPSDLNLNPYDNYAIIDPIEKLVYENIWKYFLASQMMPAIYNTLSVTAAPSNNIALKVKASGKAVKYYGFLRMLDITDDSVIDIPDLQKNQIIYLNSAKDIVSEKKQTQALPRFSEDKLIKELESKKIGRPATYAELLSKISNRNYVEKKGNVYHPTDLGKKITDVLSKYFTFMNYDYTAKMENLLDDIGSGKINHIDMLKKFYPDFKKEIDRAYVDHGGSLCEKCNSPMATRISKNKEKFLACSSYPKCHNTKSLNATITAA